MLFTAKKSTVKEEELPKSAIIEETLTKKTPDVIISEKKEGFLLIKNKSAEYIK